jgi:hypothetical protein
LVDGPGKKIDVDEAVDDEAVVVAVYLHWYQ